MSQRCPVGHPGFDAIDYEVTGLKPGQPPCPEPADGPMRIIRPDEPNRTLCARHSTHVLASLRRAVGGPAPDSDAS